MRLQKYKIYSNMWRIDIKIINFSVNLVQKDAEMEIFHHLWSENVRNGTVGADGKSARVKLKENRSRETRKRQTEGETIRGKPENKILKEWDSREAREEDTESLALAGSPQKGFLTFDARGSPARGMI